MNGIPMQRRSVARRSYDDPHTEPAAGPSAGVRPIERDSGDRRTRAAEEADARVGTTASGAAATLYTPVLDTPAVGPSVVVRPRVTNGGGAKQGNQRQKGRIARDGTLKRKGLERDPPH